MMNCFVSLRSPVFFLTVILAMARVSGQALTGPASTLLTLMDGVTLQAEEALRTDASEAACEGCALILRDTEKLRAMRQTLRQDLDRVFGLAGTPLANSGPDSTVLLGRYQLEELLLPLRDFLQTSRRDFGGSDLSGFISDPAAGRYSSQQLAALRATLEGIASVQHRDCLYSLRVRLAGAMPQPVLIVPAALNVLYTGVENPLRVFAAGADPQSVRVSGPGVRYDTASAQWFVKPVSPGTITISLNGQAPGGQPVQGNAVFEARRVPEPLIYIGGRADGIIVKRDITGQSGISARNDDFMFAAGYTINGFEMVYTPEYGSPVSSKTPGNKFTEEMLAVLKRTNPGDRLLFRVAVAFPDGYIKTLSPQFYVR